MKYYTVKQLAEKFKVTPQAIRKELKKAQYKNTISRQQVGNYMMLVVNQVGNQLLTKHFIPNMHNDNDQRTQLTTNRQQVDNQKTESWQLVANQQQARITDLKEVIKGLKDELANVHEELHTNRNYI